MPAAWWLWFTEPSGANDQGALVQLGPARHRPGVPAHGDRAQSGQRGRLERHPHAADALPGQRRLVASARGQLHREHVHPLPGRRADRHRQLPRHAGHRGLPAVPGRHRRAEPGAVRGDPGPGVRLRQGTDRGERRRAVHRGRVRPARRPGRPVRQGPNRATITWAAGPSSVRSYQVTALAGGSAPRDSVAVPGTATSAVVGGLAAGTSYTFRVTGWNGYGQGAPAISASVTPTGTSSTYSTAVLADGRPPTTGCPTRPRRSCPIPRPARRTAATTRRTSPRA